MKASALLLLFSFVSFISYAQEEGFESAFTLWYEQPANEWEEALPVGNGRLGAMIFGKYDEERIQINEETYWTGGPYSSFVEGGYKVLSETKLK